MYAFIINITKVSAVLVLAIIICYSSAFAGDGAILQGGDTFEDACVIYWLPFIDSGTTVGYNLDYENDRGDSLLNGPDVCYSFTPVADMMLDFSLCESNLNTQIYIYENYYPNLFICNDDSDSCGSGSTRSFIGDLVLYEDSTYYIVVNGRDGTAGDYVLEVDFGLGWQCGYTVGDVNGSGSTNGLDVTYGVLYFKGGDPPIDCPCPCPPHYDFHYKTGDVNASCTYNGVDITYMVSYFKGVNPPLRPCPACPPLGWPR